MSSSEKKRRHSRAGLSMIESLLAFAIIIMVVFTGISLLGNASADKRRRLERVYAAEIASSLIEERIGAGSIPTSPIGRSSWTWRLNVSQEMSVPSTISPRSYTLDRLTVQMTAPSGAENGTFSTLLIRSAQ
jgi:type II secretory pathway pseudopilin PulG